jgi:hypothetical protein
VAKITGPPRIVLENHFLTLVASESYNPNENEGESKKNLVFTWECDIEADDICKKFSTKGNFNMLVNIL